MNAKFLKEAQELEKRWGSFGLTDDRFVRSVTAKDLECERLFNETGKWDCCDECKAKEKDGNS